MPATNGKILVIRGGAIGDFILTLPVLAALRAQFPGVEIHLLGYSHIAQLALAGGLVDQVRSIEARSLASFFAKNGILPKDLAEYFGTFALIISYLYDPDAIFHENIARCSKAQFLIGPHRPDDKGALHATQVFLAPLARLAIFDADPVPRLDLSCEESGGWGAGTNEEPPPSYGRRRLALHPGSGSARKNWPAEKWAQLITRLVQETSLDFLLVGGEAEGELLSQLARLIPGPRLTMAQSLPLTELAAQLQDCWSYIGHDSGISHLAAAVGLRGLVLWGETRQVVWRPQSERMRLLQCPDGLGALPVEKVMAAIQAQ